MKKIIIKTYENKDHEASVSLIKDELNISLDDLEYNEKGKPYLKDGSMFFNISHSRGIIGITISDTEVGFDLERVKEISEDMRKMLYDKIYNEADRLNNSDDITSLQKVFAIKEAYLKYLGIGLVMDIDNIIIDYNNSTIKYKDKVSGYFKSYEYLDFVFSIVSSEPLDFEIEYRGL